MGGRGPNDGTWSLFIPDVLSGQPFSHVVKKGTARKREERGAYGRLVKRKTAQRELYFKITQEATRRTSSGNLPGLRQGTFLRWRAAE